MVTTKKVAASSSVKTKAQKKASPTALKTIAAEKKTPKKPKASKTSSISIKNNTGSTVRTTAITSKLERVEALHAKKTALKTPIKEGRMSKVLAARPAMAVALLSPYRFPIDAEKIALSTARFGGVFFVIVGAIFTLLFADSTFSSRAQLASVTVGTSDSLVQSVDSSSSGSLTYEVKPPAEFIVNTTDKLSGTVQIRLKVQYADSVTILAYNRTLNEEVTFGRPTKVSSDTWEMNVDTSKYSDGEYKLKALIKNQYGTYEAIDDSSVVIANTHIAAETTIQLETVSTSTGAATTSTTNTTTVVSDAVAVRKAVLSVDRDTSDSDFRFEIAVDNAQKVLVYAKNSKDANSRLIGYAYKSSSALWKFRWYLDLISAGTYEVSVQAVTSSGDVTSNAVLVQAIDGATTSEGDQGAATSTAVIQTEEKTAQTYIAPEIQIDIDASSPISKIVPIQVKVESAVSVELYALPKNSLVQRYLGMASKVDDDVWSFRWDTQAIPNGDYKVIIYAKNAYGTYFDDSDFLTIRNEVQVTHTEQEQKQIAEFISIAQNETERAKTSAPLEEEKGNEESIERVQQDSAAMPDENEMKLSEVLDELHKDINDELQRLASALRVKDEKAVSDIKERLQKLKLEVMQSHLGSLDEQLLVSRIDAYLQETTQRVEDDVVRIEKVITERTAQKAETDSDSDGVSDYDEIALYGTNPYGADSDGDGFTDGSEILNGYNPTDPSSEVLVAYESPKENGIVRDDILKVDSIIAVQKNEGEDATSAKAVITGKGLPNSFVTLYIFSTPIVVTVKTDNDGNWNYRFDKELEDGEHEVYIGVTDNAGKLVAKSNPLSFVKEAEAFTVAGATSQTPVAAPVERSILSEYMIYLVLSISVVAIGLVLILLGLHLDTRQRRFGSSLEESEATV